MPTSLLHQAGDDVKESTESSVLREEGVSAILKTMLGKAPAAVDRRTCDVWW